MSHDNCEFRRHLRARRGARWGAAWLLAGGALLLNAGLARGTDPTTPAEKPVPAGTAAEPVPSTEPPVRIVVPIRDGTVEPVRSPWSSAGLPEFSLHECQTGRTITLHDLRGETWVAGFIFTRCLGPCPKVSSEMAQLQTLLAGKPVRLVTVTVDPDFDTPEILQRYAKTWGCNPDRWWVLTGDKTDLYRLIKQGFVLPVQETTGPDRQPGFEVIHSTNLMHVDPQGRVIGKYNAANAGEMVKLRRVLSGADPPPDPASFWQTTAPPPAPAGGWWDRLEKLAQPAEVIPAWVLRLPAVNASLNGLATGLLLLGYGLICRGRRTAHARTMLAAFGTSVLFLACYLVYHAWAGSKRYDGPPFWRAIYLSILIPHVLLAAFVPVLALRTIWLGYRQRWEAHRRLAKVTFPLWLFVSITGVIIYFMLYGV